MKHLEKRFRKIKEPKFELKHTWQCVDSSSNFPAVRAVAHFTTRRRIFVVIGAENSFSVYSINRRRNKEGTEFRTKRIEKTTLSQSGLERLEVIQPPGFTFLMAAGRNISTHIYQ